MIRSDNFLIQKFERPIQTGSEMAALVDSISRRKTVDANVTRFFFNCC